MFFFIIKLRINEFYSITGLDYKERWMWMVAAIYRRTHSPSRLVWSEGCRPPGAQSAFIK